MKSIKAHRTSTEYKNNGQDIQNKASRQDSIDINEFNNGQDIQNKISKQKNTRDTMEADGYVKQKRQ